MPGCGTACRRIVIVLSGNLFSVYPIDMHAFARDISMDTSSSTLEWDSAGYNVSITLCTAINLRRSTHYCVVSRSLFNTAQRKSPLRYCEVIMAEGSDPG